jgi:dipeptidase
MYYHNGFLIADPNEAWVFETAGRHWAAEKVRDVRSISNVISIGSQWDRASGDLVDYALEKGWCKNKTDFNFSRCYSDLIYSKFADSRSRLCRSTSLLFSHIGEIDIPFAMNLLRDHGAEAKDDWHPGRGLTGVEICMHASFGPVRISQTTGSMISHLSPGLHTHWVTGTAAPCTSTFKPVWIDSGLPDMGPSPRGTYDDATLWWRHENLHREILRDYAARIKILKAQREPLEANLLTEVELMEKDSPQQRKTMSKKSFSKVLEAEDAWLEEIRNMPIRHPRPLLDKLAWNKFDRQAGRRS